MGPRLAFAVLAATAAAKGNAVYGQPLVMGPCDDEAIGGPAVAAALLWVTNDKVLALGSKTCLNPAEPCDFSNMYCVKAGGDSREYFNGFSWYMHQKAKYKTTRNPVAECVGECGFDAEAGLGSANGPLWRCLESDKCEGLLLFDRTLDADHECAGPTCWKLLGPEVHEAVLVDDTKTELYEFSPTYYYKLAANVDEASTTGSDDFQCESFQWAAPGYSIPDIAERCDQSADCLGFSILEPPSSSRLVCYIKRTVDKFKPSKAIEYTVKVFLKAGATVPRFFGYLAYSKSTMPKSATIQSFTTTSGYTEGDCASMCDALATCTGYLVKFGACVELVSESDTTSVSTADGQFFRKRVSSTDELSDCELLLGGCDESSTQTAIIVGSAVGGVAALLASVVVVGIFKRRKDVEPALDGDAEEGASKRLSNDVRS